MAAKHSPFDPFNPDPEKRTFDPDNPVGIGIACPHENCPVVGQGPTKEAAQIDLAYHINEAHPRRLGEYMDYQVRMENVPDTLQDKSGKPITE